VVVLFPPRKAPVDWAEALLRRRALRRRAGRREEKSLAIVASACCKRKRRRERRVVLLLLGARLVDREWPRRGMRGELACRGGVGEGGRKGGREGLGEKKRARQTWSIICQGRFNASCEKGNKARVCVAGRPSLTFCLRPLARWVFAVPRLESRGVAWT